MWQQHCTLVNQLPVASRAAGHSSAHCRGHSQHPMHNQHPTHPPASPASLISRNGKDCSSIQCKHLLTRDKRSLEFSHQTPSRADTQGEEQSARGVAASPHIRALCACANGAAPSPSAGGTGPAGRGRQPYANGSHCYKGEFISHS